MKLSNFRYSRALTETIFWLDFRRNYPAVIDLLAAISQVSLRIYFTRTLQNEEKLGINVIESAMIKEKSYNDWLYLLTVA